jgi:hypothetical protein
MAVTSLTPSRICETSTGRRGTQTTSISSGCRSRAAGMSFGCAELRRGTVRRIVVNQKPQAVQNLEEIVAATDAVMVAREIWASRWK